MDNRKNIGDSSSKSDDEARMEKQSLSTCSSCLAEFGDEQSHRTLCCGHSICNTCSEQCLSNQRVCSKCLEKLVMNNVSQRQRQQIDKNPFLRLIQSLAGDKADINNVKGSNITENVFYSSPSRKVWLCSRRCHPIIFLCCNCGKWGCHMCLITENNHPNLPHDKFSIVGVNNALEKVRILLRDAENQILIDVEVVKKSFESDIAILDFCLKYCPCDDRSHEELVQQIENQLDEDKKNYAYFEEKAKVHVKMLTSNVLSSQQLATSFEELCNYQYQLKKEISTVTERKEPRLKMILQHFRWDLKLLTQGKKPVYAFIQECKKGLKWFSLAIKDDHLLLYSLRTGSPPTDAIAVPFEYVKRVIYKHEPTSFLEVGTTGEEFGRLYMEYVNDNAATRQMKLMCTGKKGISFKGTCFYSFDEGEGEGVLHGGDYENNDGTGGKAVVDEEQLRYAVTGSVCDETAGTLTVSKESTRFQIHIHDIERHIFDPIGKVVGGKEILESISKIQPISKVMIRDCGMVIPMENETDPPKIHMCCVDYDRFEKVEDL